MQKWAEDSGRKITWKEAKYAYKELMKEVNRLYLKHKEEEWRQKKSKT